VVYRAPVKVVPAGQTQQTIGRALNVSLRGILVDTPSPYPVGTPIVCQLTFPDGTRTLRGRVVRVQPLSPSSTGIGIVFVDLSSHELASLRALVEGNHGEEQELSMRVDGSTWLFRGTAVLSENGYQLQVPMPFLRLNAAVELASSPGAPVITRALVQGVRLEPMGADGIPRLRIAVRMAGTAGTEEETDVPAGPTPAPQLLVANDNLPEITHVTAARRGILAAQAASSLALAPSRRPLFLATLALLALAGAIVVLKVPASLYNLITSRSLAISAAAPPTATVVPPAASQPEIVPVSGSMPGPPVAGEGPRFVATSDQLLADVGLRGTLTGGKQYALSAPPGLAINLPHARALAPPGKYKSTIKGFREVWVQPLRNGGTHLRFLFAAPYPSQPRVDLTPELARVAIPRTVR
jgi:Tfp pilus assembly protein PilZ